MEQLIKGKGIREVSGGLKAPPIDRDTEAFLAAVSVRRAVLRMVVMIGGVISLAALVALLWA